jgi:hypothetical protein
VLSVIDPQSRAESNTNIGRSCLPFLFTMYRMMRSKRGALLFAASLNLSSKVLSSFSINAVGKFILFNAGQYTHQKNIHG